MGGFPNNIPVGHHVLGWWEDLVRPDCLENSDDEADDGDDAGEQKIGLLRSYW